MHMAFVLVIHANVHVTLYMVVIHGDSCVVIIHRGGSRIAATSKMEHFVIIVNNFQQLTIITKTSILDVSAVLDPPLTFSY